MIEGYIERGDLTTAAQKAHGEVAWIDESLEKIRATLLEDPALKAIEDAEPPKTPHNISTTAAPDRYGTGPGSTIRMEIIDDAAPPPMELNFMGGNPKTVAYVDFTPGLRKADEIYIHHVSVRENGGYRGQGMARELVDKVYETSGESKIDWGTVAAPEMEVLRRRMIEEHPTKGNYGKPDWGITDEAKEFEAAQAQKRIAKREAKTKAAQARKSRVEARSDTYRLIRDEYMAERNKWASRADELTDIGDFLKHRKAYQDKAKQLPIQEKRLAERIAEKQELTERRQQVIEQTPPASYMPLMHETAYRALREAHTEKFAEGGSVATKLAEAGERPPEVDWADIQIRMEEGFNPTKNDLPGMSNAEISAIIRGVQDTWMEVRAVTDHPPAFVHSVNVGQAMGLGHPIRPMSREIIPTTWKGKTIDPKPTVKNLEVAVLHQTRELIQTQVDRNVIAGLTDRYATPAQNVFAQYENIARKMIDSGYRPEKGMSVAALADHLINQDKVLWNPKSLTPLTKGHWTRSNAQNAMFVDKWVAKAMDDIYPTSRSALAGVVDKAHNAFRLSILPLSPRWHINNLIGGAVMLFAEGGPHAFTQLSAARKLLKNGELPDEISVGAGNVAAADAAWGLSTGRELAHVYQNEQVRKYMATGSKASEAFKEATNASFHLGEHVDKMYRAMAFLEGKSKAERLGLGHAASRKAGVELANRVLQDWDAMTPVERSVIRMIFPFYGWMKHIMRYTFGMAVDHPVRTAIISNFARNEIEDWGTGIPERFMQMFTLGQPDINGNVKAINLKGTNPFSDVGNYMSLAGFVGQLSPIGSGFLEAMGINSATGTANLYPDTAYNEVLGRNVAKNQNPGLSILRNVIPQFDFVLDKIGMTPAELKNLKQNDPDLYSQRMLSSVGIPFIPKDINLQREAALAEIARNDDEIKAMNQALRSGDWGEAMQYPNVARLLQVLQSLPKSAVEPFLIGQRPKLSA